MGDGEKLLIHLNSALKVLLGLDIFPRVPKRKLNFVDQCYWQEFITFTDTVRRFKKFQFCKQASRHRMCACMRTRKETGVVV